VIGEVEESRLRGRGGAGFPTGLKFRTVADAPVPDGSGQRYVVDNCDEGDAGSYIDKELVEQDPHTHLEGLLLAAYACGARTPTSTSASSIPAPSGSWPGPSTRPARRASSARGSWAPTSTARSTW
jgi:formate dehydrogenase iron-sulfur subunit